MTRAPDPTDIDSLAIQLSGGEVVHVGPAFSLYSTQPRTEEINARVARVVEHFLATAGDHVTHGLIGKGHQVPFKREDLEALPEKIRQSPIKKGLSVVLHGGAQPTEASPIFLNILLPADWKPNPLGYVSYGFSMALLTEKDMSFADHCLQSCDLFEPDHGHGGFGLIGNINWLYSSDVMDQVAAILERFPGLDFPASPACGAVASDGLLAANWLTALNHEQSQALGGIDTLTKAMDDLGGRALRWSNGVLLIAPGAPQLGDSEEGHVPQNFKDVGALVSPLRGAPDASLFFGGKDRDMAAFSRQWRARFDP